MLPPSNSANLGFLDFPSDVEIIDQRVFKGCENYNQLDDYEDICIVV